ncbi:MAG: transcriptional repressor LexA [Deltaproteobacteria bacterium]|nr:transcriptional repressor LexA [Deltaproteobacteria bacterium]
MTRGLTKRQAQVLEFIEEFTNTHGYPPTVREVAANFGFRSPRAAHDHMKALEKKGFMRSQAGRPRALEVLHSRRGIPVLGKIAAGQPILAVEDAEEVLGLEAGFFGSGRFFALRVRGDSMVGDHIAEGDLVIIRSQEDARPGEVAAVLLGDEVTLKHFVPRADGLELRAANPAVQSIMVGPEDDPPRVLGVMVGLVRKN